MATTALATSGRTSGGAWRNRAALVAAGYLAGWLCYTPALADDRDVYAVRVPVDVTAESAAKARDKALFQAQAEGVQRVLQRMVLAEDQKLFTALQPDDLQRIVQGFEVSDERISQVRYIGTITMRFAAAALRERFRSAGIRFAETRSKPLLVLPVIEQDGKRSLWDERTPWLSAWAEIPSDRGLVPLVVPLADLADMQDIGGDGTLATDPFRLRRIVQRYGAGEALVLTLTSQTAGGSTTITVTGDRLPATGAIRPGQLTKTLAIRAENKIESVMPRLAQEIQAAIEEEWKQANLIGGAEQNVIAVAMELRNLGEWIAMRERLGRIAVLRSYAVKSLTRSRAELTMTFEGTVEQLRTAMVQEDLDLAQASDGWLIVPAGTGGEERPGGAPEAPPPGQLPPAGLAPGQVPSQNQGQAPAPEAPKPQ
ncbi:MAG: DUF2066 domain-containing protein [Alphaproteobacteria bacterium]|nr:DUF2066 domain-containing protein [Alphaproteobacteria bacterium]